MAKIKKVAFAFLAALLLAGIGTMSVGCDNTQEPDEEVTIGAFYSLERAYDLGFLTQSDLQMIADYHNNPVNRPENLPESVATSIKETAAYNARNSAVNPNPEAKAEDYEILKYYGNYNGSYAVILNFPYGGFSGELVDEWVTIGGVGIHYTDHYKIEICDLTDGETINDLCSLQEAYDKGLLTQSDLQMIADYHNNPVNRPENLPESVATSIKETAAYNARNSAVNPNPEAKAEDYKILKYYGTYNGYVAVMVDRKDAQYVDVDAFYTEEIGGVSFTFNEYRPKIVVWKN